MIAVFYVPHKIGWRSPFCLGASFSPLTLYILEFALPEIVRTVKETKSREIGHFPSRTIEPTTTVPLLCLIHFRIVDMFHGPSHEKMF